MAEFNYTPSGNTQVKPQVVNVNQASTTSRTLDAISKAVGTVGQAYVQKLDTDNKVNYNNAKKAYREKKIEFLNGIDGVANDSQAYKAHIDSFRATTQGLTEGLHAEHAEAFLGANENFLMYQTFNVEKLQEKEAFEYTSDAINATTNLYGGKVTNDYLVDIESNILEATEFDRIKRQDAEELIASHRLDYIKTTMTKENINYETLKSLQEDQEKLLKNYPKLKNGKSDKAVTAFIQEHKNSLDSIENSKVSLAIGNKDVDDFNKYNDRALTNTAIDKETHALNRIKFAKGITNTKEMQMQYADELFGASGGNLDIDSLKLNSSIPSAVVTRLEQLSALKINTMMQGQPDLEGLRYQNIANPKVFTNTVSNSYNTMLDSLISSYEAGAPEETIQAIGQQLQVVDNITRAMPNSLNSETRDKASMYLTVMGSAYIKNKQDAFFQLTTGKDEYKTIPTNDKGLASTLKALDTTDHTDAQKMYSTLRHVGVTEADAKNAVTDRFNPRDIKGSSVKITGKATDYFGLAPEREEFLLSSLQSIYKGNEKLGNDFKRAIAQEGAKVSFIGGELVVSTDTGTKARFPLNPITKVLEDGTKKIVNFKDELDRLIDLSYRRENKPDVWDNIGATVMNSIVDMTSSIWRGYEGSIIAEGGRAIPNQAGNVIEGVSTEASRLYNQSIKNYQKWKKDMNKLMYDK